MANKFHKKVIKSPKKTQNLRKSRNILRKKKIKSPKKIIKHPNKKKCFESSIIFSEIWFFVLRVLDFFGGSIIFSEVWLCFSDVLIFFSKVWFFISRVQAFFRRFYLFLSEILFSFFSEKNIIFCGLYFLPGKILVIDKICEKTTPSESDHLGS